MNAIQSKEIEFYELKSETLTVRISNYGARLVSFERNGKDMLYGPKTAKELLSDECYCGAICGRVANRIEKGLFTLDGVTHRLAVNNGPNHLHGGNVGFSHVRWSLREADEKRLVLTYHSCDGEENYPGNLDVTATYSLEGSALSLSMKAKSEAPTIVNLTNHAYWNLSDTATVDGHQLEVTASAYTPVDSTNIPTGSILPVKDTDFDLRRGAVLGERNSSAHPATANGYDHNFVLPISDQVRKVAVLFCPSSGRKLIVSTDAPGLQVYTGEYLPNPRGGVALEAQGFPNAVNVPHFPSVILRPGEVFSRTISWTLI